QLFWVGIFVAATFGCQSMVERLRIVLVRKPDDSFATPEPKAWGYTAIPDLKAARKEHDAFVALIRASGAEVWYHNEPQKGKADAIFCPRSRDCDGWRRDRPPDGQGASAR